MKIKEVLKLLKIRVDGKKNKRHFIMPLKKYIKDGLGLASVVYMDNSKLNRLVLRGKLKLITKSGGAKYYQIIYREIENMAMVVKDEMAKIIPLDSVGVLSKFIISECSGNFIVTLNKKSICIEKIILHIATGESIDELRKKEIHHKWYRFVAMPGMIVSMTQWNHRMGHARTSYYARNQSVSFHDFEFEEFISVVHEYKKNIEKNEFGIEF